tara:strand:+ start:75 stop:308 length:234 start_codon:yes stop_codon:yes gene_type:complete
MAMTTESVYNDLPRHVKDGAGLPAYFYDLTPEQRFFVEDFYEAVATPEPEDEIQEVVELVGELALATEALQRRYTGK